MKRNLKTSRKTRSFLSRQIRLSPIFHLLLSMLISWMFSIMDLRTRFAHPRSTKRTSSHALNWLVRGCYWTSRESKDTGKLATGLPHLAQTYVSSYRPTASDLKKHRIQKELRKSKNIVILRPDKGNWVVILDRVEYDKGLFKIINDTTKFRVLTSDPTLTWEGKLRRYLRDRKKKGHFDPDV